MSRKIIKKGTDYMEYSVSPEGEKFKIPDEQDYKKEYLRLEKLAHGEPRGQLWASEVDRKRVESWWKGRYRGKRQDIF